MLAYGLSVAGTTHMMFSFRFFVPYIPALTIIIADLFYIQKEEGSDDIKINKSNKWFVTSLMITIIFQAIQAGYTYQYSVNGIALNGELRKYSIKENNNFMKIAKDFSFVIKNHWNSLPVSKSRQPRIYTFGEGILPYTYMEAYFSGVLISHRHNCSLMLDRPMVDYMLLYKPGFSDKDKTDENTQIIKVVPFAFNGADGSVVLYFNENPCENYLPEKINDPCKQYAP